MFNRNTGHKYTLKEVEEKGLRLGEWVSIGSLGEGFFHVYRGFSDWMGGTKKYSSSTHERIKAKRGF